MVQAAALEDSCPDVQLQSMEETTENLPAALKILSEMSTNAEQVTSLVDQMLERVRSGEFSTEYGLSFLEVKYQMLLDYLINLTFVVLRKCTGQTIENNPAIDRLIELRTVLEKIRPIDYKLRYQIDKLVKTATTGVEDINDPSNFKARPELLTNQVVTQDESESGSDDDDDNSDIDHKKLKDQLYRPPKLTAMHYDDDPMTEKNRKQFERLKKRALQSSIIQEMKEEYLDTPIEISEGSKVAQMYNKAEKERERYEEDNLVRLPITKADKHRQRQMTTLGTLGNEITSFRDISMLTGGRKDMDMSGKKGKKRKGTGGKKSKGKKRKFH